MSFLMSSRAKRNPFSVLHGAKGSFLILQRQVQLRLREPKTETMLAWGASFLLTGHVSSLLRCCEQILSKTRPSAPWGEKKGATGPAPMNLECVKRISFPHKKGETA